MTAVLEETQQISLSSKDWSGSGSDALVPSSFLLLLVRHLLLLAMHLFLVASLQTLPQAECNKISSQGYITDLSNAG